MIKNTLILMSIAALVAGCSSPRNDPVKQRCHAALAQAQKFRTYPLNDLQSAFRSSSTLSDVPIVIGRGAIPQDAVRGSMVVEVDAPPSVSQSQLGGAKITNFYCKT